MVGPVKRGGFYRPGVSNFMGTPICYLQAAFAIHWGNGVSLSVLLSTSRIFDFDGRACKKGGFLQAGGIKLHGYLYLLSTSRILVSIGMQ
jgi:hypothetical protein